METLKDCNTCGKHVQAEVPPLNCKLCLALSKPSNYLPGWIPMSKSYDSTFREEGDCLCGPRLEAPSLKATGVQSDGSTASYYELPEGATQLQDLISFKNMNAQIGEIFRACYRMGQASHSNNLRDAKKILFYAKAEVERLEKMGDHQ